MLCPFSRLSKALKLDQVGMAVTIDIGLADDIHPKNKQEVGRRLACLLYTSRCV